MEMKIEDFVITLYGVLRIVTVVGLIATDVLMTAIIYRKIRKYYPEKTDKFRWAFFLGALLSSLLLIYIYYRLFEISTVDPRVPSKPRLLF
jgi:hypothetical protein